MCTYVEVVGFSVEPIWNPKELPMKKTLQSITDNAGQC